MTRPGYRSPETQARSQARFNTMKRRALTLLRRFCSQLSTGDRERLAIRLAVIELKYAEGDPYPAGEDVRR